MNENLKRHDPLVQLMINSYEIEFAKQLVQFDALEDEFELKYFPDIYTACGFCLYYSNDPVEYYISNVMKSENNCLSSEVIQYGLDVLKEIVTKLSK